MADFRRRHLRVFGKAESPKANRAMKAWLALERSERREKEWPWGLTKKKSLEGERTVSEGGTMLKRCQMGRGEEMDKILSSVRSEKMVTRPMLRVWGSKYSQKVALQIEVKSYWYCKLEEPEASEGLKGKGWTCREKEVGKTSIASRREQASTSEMLGHEGGISEEVGQIFFSALKKLWKYSSIFANREKEKAEGRSWWW